MNIKGKIVYEPQTPSPSPPTPFSSYENSFHYHPGWSFGHLASDLTKPYNFCELIHFCQGLKRHHILKQDELDTSDFSLVYDFWPERDYEVTGDIESEESEDEDDSEEFDESD